METTPGHIRWHLSCLCLLIPIHGYRKIKILICRRPKPDIQSNGWGQDLVFYEKIKSRHQQYYKWSWTLTPHLERVSSNNNNNNIPISGVLPITKYYWVKQRQISRAKGTPSSTIGRRSSNQLIIISESSVINPRLTHSNTFPDPSRDLFCLDPDLARTSGQFTSRSRSAVVLQWGVQTNPSSRDSTGTKPRGPLETFGDSWRTRDGGRGKTNLARLPSGPVPPLLIKRFTNVRRWFDLLETESQFFLCPREVVKAIHKLSNRPCQTNLPSRYWKESYTFCSP